MSYGYSARFIQLNKDANPEFLGVRFGHACISNNVSVIEVARKLGVTRQTVYNWFSGATSPLPVIAPAVELYLSSLG